jgi:hypothetical protein
MVSPDETRFISKEYSMKRNLSWLFFVLLLTFSSGVLAQSPVKILKQASKALGGERALQNVNSRQRKGKITRLQDGASGSFQAQTALPNFYNESYDFGGFETESGFNGKSGWRRDSRDGLRTLTGEASRDFAAEAGFRNSAWFDYKKDKSKITANGRTDINGKNANSLILTTAKGVAIKLYFDAATNLLLREEIPAGVSAKTFDYSDYRIVDGINEPFTINAKIGEESYLIKLEEVSRNRQIAKENFDFPKISDEPLPGIPALLKEVQTNEDRIEELRESYTYTQTNVFRAVDKTGKLSETGSDTYQITFYKGNHIRRLIAKSGRPLSADEQRDEDKRVGKSIGEIEKNISKKQARNAAQSSTDEPDDDDKNISAAETLRASRLINPRRERFRGRDVIVFDFEPNPDFDYKKAKSALKFFGKIAGAMWIDAQDKQVARIESFLVEDFKVGGGMVANLRKGASFSLEQQRVNDEIWLPSIIDFNVSIKLFLIKGFNFNQVIKYGDYQKFNTEVKSSKVDEIKNP